jgi:hypothetical protein
MATFRTILATTTSISLALGALSSAAAEQSSVPMNTHTTATADHQDMSLSMSDQAGMAQRLEAEAVQYDQQATKHERMAKNYRAGAGTKGNSAALAAHCERIAENFRDSATNAREMARMHRDNAHSAAK